ncbi:MAG: MFS transporter [Acidimicrobiia bacterium]|nr:MFS transporter [Acidimicrobiia bacterium]
MTEASLTVVQPHAASGLRRALQDALPLLAGVGLLMAGNGLTSTLLGVRAALEGFRPSVTGLVLAGYYLGFLGGSLAAPAAIRRAGHVRVFAGLASLAAAAVLIHSIRPEPPTWFLVRVVSGLCISALYVVTETWLNGAATNSTRGGLLASYMVVVTGGLLCGQVLFTLADPGGFAVFVLASVLISLAVVPVALATVSAPDVPPLNPLSLRGLVAVAPLGPAGAALAGFSGAAIVGAGAVYSAEAGLGRVATATLIGSALAGGLALQVPLGRWSDRVDRRLVIAAGGVVAAGAALAASAVGPDRLPLLVGLTLVAGGFAFPLYSLSSAHLNDYLDQDRLVAAGARMVLVNGAGSVAGPIVGAAAIGLVGPGALFVALSAAYLTVALFALYRTTRRGPVPKADRAHYVPYPLEAGLTVSALAEGAGDELYPVGSGSLDIAGSPLTYRDQGSGRPVVLVGGPGAATRAWDGVPSALAADGVRAVVPELRADIYEAGEHVEDLLAVLRFLELPEASFVGHGRGAAVVAQLAAEHPDRVDAIVLVGRPEDDLTGEAAVAAGGGLGEGFAQAGAEAGGAEEGVDAGTILILPADQLMADGPDAFADIVVEFLRHR